jgi:hypothetical protein
MSRRIAILLLFALSPIALGFVGLLHAHAPGEGGDCDAAACQICFLRAVASIAVLALPILVCVRRDWRPAAPILPPSRVIALDNVASISPRAPPFC